MRLESYLKNYDVSPQEFAALINVHVATVYRVLRGEVFPKRGNLKAIISATNGKVTANDLIRATSMSKEGIRWHRFSNRKDPPEAA